MDHLKIRSYIKRATTVEHLHKVCNSFHGKALTGKTVLGKRSCLYLNSDSCRQTLGVLEKFLDTDGYELN